MRKIAKIIIPLIVLTLIGSMPLVKSDYQVSVGNTFIFDVETSFFDLTFGTNQANAAGYKIAGHAFNPDTSVSVEVLDIESESLLYNISAAGYSESKNASNADTDALIEQSLFPLEIIQELATSEFNETKLEQERHYGILMKPFLNVLAGTWDLFKQVTEDLAVNHTILGYTFESNLIVNATYDDNGTIFVFEFYFGDKYITTISTLASNISINLDIEHNYQFAYVKSTGVMLGMRMKGTVDGNINETAFSFVYNYRTEQNGYDLPNFKFGGLPSWPFPGLTVVITFVSIAILSSVVIISRKRK